MKTPPVQWGAADKECIIHSEFRAFDIWAICLVKDSFTAGTEAIGWILIVQRNQSIQADSGSWPDENTIVAYALLLKIACRSSRL
jgi:hypothetical protein